MTKKHIIVIIYGYVDDYQQYQVLQNRFRWYKISHKSQGSIISTSDDKINKSIKIVLKEEDPEQTFIKTCKFIGFYTIIPFFRISIIIRPRSKVRRIKSTVNQVFQKIVVCLLVAAAGNFQRAKGATYMI